MKVLQLLDEQRTTRWMQGKSFEDFTMPDGRTIEGFPPVCRVTICGSKKVIMILFMRL